MNETRKTFESVKATLKERYLTLKEKKKCYRVRKGGTYSQKIQLVLLSPSFSFFYNIFFSISTAYFSLLFLFPLSTFHLFLIFLLIFSSSNFSSSIFLLFFPSVFYNLLSFSHPLNQFLFHLSCMFLVLEEDDLKVLEQMLRMTNCATLPNHVMNQLS